MIPFEEIDSRLESIGKDRAWLAANTPYSAAYIRDLMAPKSTRRTERVQQIISDAIEKEEECQRSTVRLPDHIALSPTPDEFDAWDRASRAAKAETLKDWAIDELNKAAAAWSASKVIHVAAGSPISADGDTYAPTRQLGPGRFACQLHGDSMAPTYPDGSVIILRERDSLKKPVLKKGEIYLFDIGGEKTLKIYDSRPATDREIAVGIAYTSKSDGFAKVRILRSINPDFDDIRVTDTVAWLGWLDRKDNSSP